jgi:AcrR family transcriptional regulator
MASIPDRAGEARRKLIEAGINQFGRKGPDGTSTREIARAAGVNIAAIAYHFGGKQQLYLACAKYIAETVRDGVTARLGHAGDAIGAVPELSRTLASIAEFMLANPRIADFVRFVMREQMEPSPAFDVLYATFMEPMHKRLCGLWAAATGGDPESEHTKLKVFALVAQIFFFRLARAGALRRLGWAEIGPGEITAITTLAAESVEALVSYELQRRRR